MKYVSRLFFRHGSLIVDAIKKLTLLTILHHNVNRRVSADHLVYLSNILVEHLPLHFNLSLDGLQLRRRHAGSLTNFDCHFFSGGDVDGFLDVAETALADDLAYIINFVPNS